LRLHRSGSTDDELVEGDRQVADPDAGRVVDGVGYRGGDAYDADLADALDADGVQPLGLAHEDDVHVGNVGVDGPEGNAERRVGDAAGVGVAERLLEQGHADAAHGGSDDLARGQLRVQDAPAVDRRHDARDPDQSEVGIDAYLHELGGEGASRSDAEVLRPGGWTIAVGGQLVQTVPSHDLGVSLALPGGVFAADAALG